MNLSFKLAIALGLLTSPVTKSMEQLSDRYIIKSKEFELTPCAYFSEGTKTHWKFFDKESNEKVCTIKLRRTLDLYEKWRGELDILHIEKKFRGNKLGPIFFHERIVNYFRKHNHRIFYWCVYPIDFDKTSLKITLVEAQEKLVQWYEDQGGIVDGADRGFFAAMYYVIK